MSVELGSWSYLRFPYIITYIHNVSFIFRSIFISIFIFSSPLPVRTRHFPSLADRRTTAEKSISGNTGTADSRLYIRRGNTVSAGGLIAGGLIAVIAVVAVVAVVVAVSAGGTVIAASGSQIDTLAKDGRVAILLEVDVGGRRIRGEVAVGVGLGGAAVVADDPGLHLVALELGRLVRQR